MHECILRPICEFGCVDEWRALRLCIDSIVKAAKYDRMIGVTSRKAKKGPLVGGKRDSREGISGRNDRRPTVRW